MMMIRHICISSVVFLLATTSVVGQQRCNICGEGNTIQYPQGVVEFMYQGQPRKNNCQTWQQIVNNPVAISTDFCVNEMLQYTHFVCRCTTPNGQAVEWIPPTMAPSTSAPATAYPTTAVPTTGTTGGMGAPTELPREWATPSLATPFPIVAIPTVSLVVTEAPALPTISSEEVASDQEVTSAPTNESPQRSGAFHFSHRSTPMIWLGIGVLVALA